MPLWRRNYLAVWPSLFVVSMGLLAFLPMLPLYIRDQFGVKDPDEVRAWAGLAFGIAPLVAAFCGPFWGVLGDRHGRKPMALRAVLGIALVTALMPLAATPAQFVALRALQGALAGYVAPAMALVAADAPAERQSRTLGGLQVGMALGLLAGPVLGSEVAAAFGRDMVFYVTSGLAFCGAIPVMLFAREGTRPAPADRPGLRDILRFVGQPAVAWLMLAFVMIRGGQLMVDAYLALWVAELGPIDWITATARDQEHAVDRTTALMFTVLAIAQILFTPFWGRAGDRFGPLRSFVVLCVGMGLMVGLAGFVQDIDLYLILRCGSAVFGAGILTLAYAAVSKRVRPNQKSVAFACVQSFLQLGMFFGPLAGGFIASLCGLRGIFWAAGLLSLLAAALMLWIRRRGG